MRPSGRKAIRQGSSKVAVVVMLKGNVASGFCSPTLTCAQAATAQVNSRAALAKFIVILLVLSIYSSVWRKLLRHRDRHRLAGSAFGNPDRVACGLDCCRCFKAVPDYRDSGFVSID